MTSSEELFYQLAVTRENYELKNAMLMRQICRHPDLLDHYAKEIEKAQARIDAWKEIGIVMPILRVFDIPARCRGEDVSTEGL